jgi:hypothetical protein
MDAGGEDYLKHYRLSPRLALAAFTTASALLFFAIAMVYVESIYTPHNLAYGSEGSSGWTLVVYGNNCTFDSWTKNVVTDLNWGLSVDNPEVGKPNPGELQLLGAFGSLTQWHFLGCGFDHVNIPNHANFPGVETATQVWMPTWLLLFITGVWPLCRLLRFRARLHQRRRRRKFGLCPRCGYDCRATPDRCSEWGFGLKITAAPRRNSIY